MRGLLTVLAIVAVVAVQYAETRSLLKKGISKHRFFRGRRWQGFVVKPERPANPAARVETQHFTHLVDHLDPSNNKTYLQRFWFNDEWYKPGGPQFLMIGGEAAADPVWLESDLSQYAILAKEVGAIAFLLEHRFYGKSQPTGDLKFESLKYLTSEQALADVNNFILAQNKVFNITSPRWITFGGSYPGALSAWARQKYPDTIYAAVGSSAPVQAVVDFTGYLDVVYNALHSHDPKCADSAHKGFLKLNDLLKTSSGRNTLHDKFNICEDFSNPDNNTLYTFYDGIIGSYEFFVQYSENNVEPHASEKTISTLCERQLGADSDLDGVVAVNQWMAAGCLNINYQTVVNNLKNAEVGDGNADYRAWIWQTCNEFGYYQSTDSDLVTNKFTGADIPIDYYVQQCAQIFDVSLDNTTVYSNVDKTNAYYYGQTGYNGTRVSLPNGTNDPWHSADPQTRDLGLGVLNATNSQVYPTVITGTGHCADMYAPSPDDTPALVAARKIIRGHVLSWVKA